MQEWRKYHHLIQEFLKQFYKIKIYIYLKKESL